MAKRAKVRRGGVHQKVAKHIDEMFNAGTYDLPAWIEFSKSQTYETPPNTERNAFANAFALEMASGADTHDVAETSLYGEGAFQYMVWNRKIHAVQEVRIVHFKRLRAASGVDAVDSDSTLE
jgi:hypothetical protein